MRVVWFAIFLLSACGAPHPSEFLATPACVQQGLLPDNFGVVDAERGMFRSGLTHSAENLRCLQEAYNITGIVNLMGAVSGDDEIVDWEQETAADLGLDFYHLPFEIFRSTDRQTIGKLYGLFEEAMTNEEVRLLVHCQHGRDRAGVGTALFKERYGLATREEAYAEYVNHRTIWLPGLSATLDREWETPSEPIVGG